MPRFARPRVRPLLGLLAVALLLGSCAGGDNFSVDTGQVAQRFLPTERKVDHHPDSLRAVSIEQEEEGVELKLDRSYESLHRKWSCTYQDLGTRSSSGRQLSYATFWSLELSLSALQPEVGINTLSGDQAQKLLKERRKEYQSTIQIDVYWFEAEGRSTLTGAGNRAELQVKGNRYEPQKETHGPLREAFLPEGGRTTLYRRNTFYFPRIVDGTDLLRESDTIELMLNRTGASPRTRFVWSWEDASSSDES